jgi:hypothetical protein
MLSTVEGLRRGGTTSVRYWLYALESWASIARLVMSTAGFVHATTPTVMKKMKNDLVAKLIMEVLLASHP